MKVRSSFPAVCYYRISLAAHGSFQKRQKEAARREKRQLKLDRRQGRQPVTANPATATSEDNDLANAASATDTTPAHPTDLAVDAFIKPEPRT